MRTLALLLLIAPLAGCNPYVAAVSVVSQTYGVATDERSLSTQAADTEIEGSIEAQLVASPVEGTGSLSVYSRRGVVVLTGVVEPGSDAGNAAVRIARATPKVARVETFFVASRPSEATDIEIEGKIKAALVADSSLKSDQVDVAVYAGHAVLIGVVASPEQIQRFVDDTRDVDGVLSVRSYIQLEG